jgi:hypothetical protein
MMQVVYTDLEKEFTDFDKVEERLVDVFKHLKYHLPDAPLPSKIITYNAAFSFGVVSTDSIIGIGLEMYLGQENRIIQEIRFPVYMKEKMHRDYLPMDVAHSWLMTNVFVEGRGETFLSSLIYFGKLRYMMKGLMPDLPDHQLMRYTQEEYDYA